MCIISCLNCIYEILKASFADFKLTCVLAITITVVNRFNCCINYHWCSMIECNREILQWIYFFKKYLSMPSWTDCIRSVILTTARSNHKMTHNCDPTCMGEDAVAVSSPRLLGTILSLLNVGCYHWNTPNFDCICAGWSEGALTLFTTEPCMLFKIQSYHWVTPNWEKTWKNNGSESIISPSQRTTRLLLQSPTTRILG